MCWPDKLKRKKNLQWRMQVLILKTAWMQEACCSLCSCLGTVYSVQCATTLQLHTTSEQKHFPVHNVPLHLIQNSFYFLSLKVDYDNQCFLFIRHSLYQAAQQRALPDKRVFLAPSPQYSFLHSKNVTTCHNSEMLFTQTQFVPDNHILYKLAFNKITL